MTTSTLSTIVTDLPALAVICVTIYAAYWLLGLVQWPRIAGRDRLLAAWSEVDLGTQGGFRLRALGLVSVFSLYLELLLIRWVSSEIRIFAYFKSLVLIACFLGFGLGCYLTRSKIRALYTIVPVLALVWLVELPWYPLRFLIASLSDAIGWLSDVHVWHVGVFQGSPALQISAAVAAMLIVIPLFGLIALTFIPLGQMVGWYIEQAPNGVTAYSVNVLASIAGIWLYTLLCFLSSPPLAWFSLFALGLALCFWRWRRLRLPMVVSLAAVLALLAVGSAKSTWWGERTSGTLRALRNVTPAAPRTFWSPYQKLSLIPFTSGADTVMYLLNTNDSWYQQILDLSPAAAARHPELYGDVPLRFHQYNLPYQFYPRPPHVLIAGAGMGNDAAAALRNGAGSVDAVEIDPLIYRKGGALHFEHPYRSDRVRVHVDDARHFLQQATDHYDLIVFSILDSHTTSSYFTNIRLDNYVYTVESMRTMKRLLKPDGLFVMSFDGSRSWFAGRLHAVVSQAFGKEPLMIRSAGPAFFIVGPDDRVATVLRADSVLAQFVKEHGNPDIQTATVTTDDWPYLYQQDRGIPAIVWIFSFLLVAISWRAFVSLKRTGESFHWHFFLLGAAFMLLEVQIISKMALLFGTTWMVNSIVITTLLLFILLSNLVVLRAPRFPVAVAYAGLLGTLALSYLIPTDRLFFASGLAQAAVATGLYCSPVFFAGLVFIGSFRRVGFKAEAFGANLLGALVGGLLESLSYATGIRALVIVAAALYLLSWLTLGRGASAGALATAPG